MAFRSFGNWFGFSVPRPSLRVPLLPVAADTDADRFEWDITAAVGERLPGHEDQAVAAGHFHMHYGQAFDITLRDHRSQLCDIRLRVIKLRAGYRQRFALEQLFLEIRIGKRGAISREQHIGILEKGCGRRHQVQLDRPLCQA